METINKRDLPANKKNIKVISINREETVSIGAILGSYLKSGDIVCLDGDLGVGKTAFTSGIAQGMGISGIISSPSFTILIEHTKHDINIPLYHFDAYRIDCEQDFYELGFDEYFSYDGICVIEWADKISAAIPEYAIHVTLRQGSDDISDLRLLEFEFSISDGRAELFFEKLKSQKFKVSYESAKGGNESKC